MQTLKSTLPILRGSALPVLDQKAGATRRERGRAWMKKRQGVLLRDRFACVRCGRVSLANEVDHAHPLEAGGSNDARNLQTLCRDCHVAKSAHEQRTRFGAPQPRADLVCGADGVSAPAGQGGCESLPPPPPETPLSLTRGNYWVGELIK